VDDVSDISGMAAIVLVLFALPLICFITCLYLCSFTLPKDASNTRSLLISIAGDQHAPDTRWTDAERLPNDLPSPTQCRRTTSAGIWSSLVCDGPDRRHVNKDSPCCNTMPCFRGSDRPRRPGKTHVEGEVPQATKRMPRKRLGRCRVVTEHTTENVFGSYRSDNAIHLTCVFPRAILRTPML